MIDVSLGLRNPVEMFTRHPRILVISLLLLSLAVPSYQAKLASFVIQSESQPLALAVSNAVYIQGVVN